MIQIQSNAAPVILLNDGLRATQANNILVVADLANFASGKCKIVFDNSIYGHELVKSTLKTIQHDKCCFCESQVTHIAYGDVEHFRPKAGWRKKKGEKLSRPGYFWLAYDWSNLLFCCEICNRREKKSHFPIENELDRCVFPNQNVSNERPLFINPRFEDPEVHIGFRGEVPFAKGNSKRGRVTISYLGLKRKPLQSKRAALLNSLKYAYYVATGIVSASNDLRIEAKNLLDKFTQPTAEYSSAVKCAIGDGFRYC